MSAFQTLIIVRAIVRATTIARASKHSPDRIAQAIAQLLEQLFLKNLCLERVVIL